MLIRFTKPNSYLDSCVWKILLLIIFLLCCLLILFCWWKQYVKHFSVQNNSNQKLVNNHQQPFETLLADTIRKIPLQRSLSKRRTLVSKPLKTNKKKSSIISSRFNKSRRTAKSDQPIDSSSTIKISLVVSKENNDQQNTKPIDQALSNISLLTIHGIEELKSKSRSISLELPLINNKTENH